VRSIRIRAAWGALMALGLAAASARATETVKMVYQPVGGFSNVFVAAHQGFFTKHGLDVKFQATQIASNVPALLASGQFDIGGPTVVPVLQADENGLDLVILAGGGVYPLPGDGLVAGTGSGIEHARDLAGKTAGVPGLGTQLDVLLRWGLKQSGIDLASVRYVEIGFLQASDALKSRIVDAYTSVEPFTQRIEKAGAGKLLMDWPEVPDGTTTVVYASTRTWATAHHQAVGGFYAALREADAFIKTHHEDTMQANAEFTKLPLPVIQSMPISEYSADLSDKQMQFWIDLASDQKLIQGHPKPSDILFK
jgi:NitT/TauT family transport system substrate-binding protein